MSLKHHKRRVDRAPQIPDLDSVVCGARGDVVLVFVEVEAEDLVIVAFDCSHAVLLSHVPDSEGFVAGAGGDYLLVGGVPHGLVDYEVVVVGV